MSLFRSLFVPSTSIFIFISISIFIFNCLSFYSSEVPVPDIYDGPLTAEDIVRYVYRKTDPIISLTGPNDAYDFILSWQTAVIAFFDGDNGTAIDANGNKKDWVKEYDYGKQTLLLSVSCLFVCLFVRLFVCLFV